MRRGLAAGALLCVLALPAGATPAQWRKIDGDPDFNGYRGELQRMVDQFGHARANSFCVVVWRDGRDRLAYVHWPQEHQLYRWAPSVDEVSGLNEVGGGPLDLRGDVVTSEREIAGSTFRVTRAWVANVLSRCRRNGTRVTVTRSDAKPGTGAS